MKERIRQRTNLPLGPSIDTHGETFLSQEVVVNLLQETKQAFERCHRVRVIVNLFYLHICILSFALFILRYKSALCLGTTIFYNKNIEIFALENRIILKLFRGIFVKMLQYGTSGWVMWVFGTVISLLF